MKDDVQRIYLKNKEQTEKMQTAICTLPGPAVQVYRYDIEVLYYLDVSRLMLWVSLHNLKNFNFTKCNWEMQYKSYECQN